MIDKKDFIIMLISPFVVMMLAILACMYVMQRRFENTQRMYDHFKKLGFSVKDTNAFIPHDKLDLLHVTLSDPLCISAILLAGFGTIIAIISEKIS